MADKKIADLQEATTTTDTDILIIQDNANTKKITWTNLKTAIIGAFSSILGNRTYTEQNVVTNGESITNSINELDKGVIVESGLSGSIYYTKWADGTAVCWGSDTVTNFSTSYVDITLPFSFINTASMQVDANTNNNLSGSLGYAYLVEPKVQGSNIVRVKAMTIGPSGVNNVGANTSVRFKVIGKWK